MFQISPLILQHQQLFQRVQRDRQQLQTPDQQLPHNKQQGAMVNADLQHKGVDKKTQDVRAQT